jgi:hypothetical protein
MASSSRGPGRTHDVEIDSVPPALRTQLGERAPAGLLEVLARSYEAMREPVIAACTERFERRLIEEISGVRVQLADVDSGLRHETSQMGGHLRQEMMELRAGLRQEMSELRTELRGDTTRLRFEIRQEIAHLGAELRQEISQLGAQFRCEHAASLTALRQEIAAGRFELLKWNFMFWAGQVLAVGGLIGVMLRFAR